MARTMTLKALRAAVAPCSLRVQDGELRVNLPLYMGGNEDTAYYTTCREDALETAKAMLAAADREDPRGPGRLLGRYPSPILEG